MSWDLIASISVFVVFMAVIVVLEIRTDRRNKRMMDESDKCVIPAAKKTDELHIAKYGRPSTELQKVFPEIKVAK
jgi:hypothetical protein